MVAGVCQENARAILRIHTLHVPGVQARRAPRFQRSAPAPSSVDRAPLLLWHFTVTKSYFVIF